IAKLPNAIETNWGNRYQTGPMFLSSVTVGRVDVTVFDEPLFTSIPVDDSKRTQAYSIHHATWSWNAESQKKYASKFAEMMTEDIEPIVPPSAVFIVVDKGRDHETTAGRRVLPYPEHNGQWGGYPADGAAAVAELERLRIDGA